MQDGARVEKERQRASSRVQQLQAELSSMRSQQDSLRQRLQERLTAQEKDSAAKARELSSLRRAGAPRRVCCCVLYPLFCAGARLGCRLSASFSAISLSLTGVMFMRQVVCGVHTCFCLVAGSRQLLRLLPAGSMLISQPRRCCCCCRGLLQLRLQRSVWRTLRLKTAGRGLHCEPVATRRQQHSGSCVSSPAE